MDRNSPVPLYHQLEEILLQQIQDGAVEPGEALPGEKELEAQYGVSRITVRRALRELAARGFISRQAGRGTFVLPRKVEHHSLGIGGIWDDLAAFGMDVEWTILQCEMQPAPSHIARKLGIEEGQLLFYVQRLVLADGEPFSMTTGYHHFEEGITFTREELEGDSIYRLLESKYGIALGRVERVMEATLALEHEAEQLDVRLNSPMLLVELSVYDRQGRLISFRKNVYRGDRYKYRHTIDL